MSLSDASIKRPIAMSCLIIGLLLLGLNAWRKMGLELMPKMDAPFITIVTIYPGASPEEIETDVAKRIEDAVVTATGIMSDILVTASSGSILVSIAVGGAFAGDFALGGSLTVNSIANTLDAHIKNSTLVQAGRDINLVAVERDTLVAVAGGFAGSSHSSAVGAALAYNYIGGSLDPGNPDLIDRDSTAVDQITAYIDNAHVVAGDDILISAGENM